MGEYKSIIPVGMRPRPDMHEKIVAKIMAEYFKSDVSFIKCSSVTTPDILVIRTRQYWEIKNIRGNSKRTIQNNLRNADNQSKKVIISLFRTDMTSDQATGRVKECLRNSRVQLESIIVVTKNRKIIVIK